MNRVDDASAPWRRNRVSILGVGVDRVDMPGAVATIERFIISGRPHQVVTVNPEFVIAARGNVAFHDVLQDADLAVADGIGVVWAARLLGAALPERIGGIDLVTRLAAAAETSGARVFLLGAAEGVAMLASERLRTRHPRLNVVGAYAGSPRQDDEPEIQAMIRAARPDILLVAFGAPAQDLWIARNLPALGVPVAIGVGGAFDFLAGRVKRAPLALRRLGLEWLYRLARQPWRWRRMLALPQFAFLILSQRLSRGHVTPRSDE